MSVWMEIKSEAKRLETLPPPNEEAACSILQNWLKVQTYIATKSTRKTPQSE